jgi:hypothetical protein
MPTLVNWNGTAYSIPNVSELNWSSLSAFLIDLGTNAAISQEADQAIRVALTTPVTVAAATDYAVVTDLTAPGAVAVNLPAGVDGQIFVVVDGKGDAATNNVTITPAAGTIGGAATIVLTHNRQTVMLQYHAGTTDWKVLANTLFPGTITSADITGTIAPSKGGTGVANNDAATLTRTGNHAVTITTTGVTSVTLPTSGTLVASPVGIADGGTGQTTQTASFDALAPTTTKGDAIYHNGSDNVRVAVGTNGQALVADSGAAAGVSYASVVTDPTTTRGDLIRRGAAVLERLPAATDNRVVRGDGTDVVSGQIDDPNFFTTGAEVTQTLPGVVLSAGQLKGTNTNDNAAAGYVGEYVEDVNTGVALTTGTSADIGTLSLTAGDWDVVTSSQFNAAATTIAASYTMSISKTSATNAGTTGYPTAGEIIIAANFDDTTGNNDRSFFTPPVRVSLSATTNIYGVVTSSFTVSTMTASGAIWARRVR